MGTIWLVLRQAAVDWNRHQATTHGAALAFFSMLSLAPLMILLVRLIGVVFGEEAAQGQLVERIEALSGREAALTLQSFVEASGRPEGGIVATVLGVGALLFGASAVFVQVQTSLNMIWGAPESPRAGVVEFLRRRALSFAMTLGLGMVVLASLVVSAWFAAAERFFSDVLPQVGAFNPWLDLAISFVVLTAVFALVFKILPDARIAWRDVAAGAAGTALLFLAGRHGIGLYLGHSAVASASGAAGSFMALILWIYYSALIFYFGAEITHAWATHAGSRQPVVPARSNEEVSRDG